MYIFCITRLKLQPRTAKKEEETSSDATAVANPSIFGADKPVDTASKDQEIEKKLTSLHSTAAPKK